jgi:hypothetical protein
LGVEAAGDGGAAVLAVVEAGGVEGIVEVERSGACVCEGEPLGVRAEQPVVDLAGPFGHPCKLRAAKRSHLGAHAELVARHPVGHPEADEAFDGAPRAPAACDRRAQAEGLASSRRSTTAGSRSRHRMGRRRRTSNADGPRPRPRPVRRRGHRA